jgi:hypothetical protein
MEHVLRVKMMLDELGRSSGETDVHFFMRSMIGLSSLARSLGKRSGIPLDLFKLNSSKIRQPNDQTATKESFLEDKEMVTICFLCINSFGHFWSSMMHRVRPATKRT